MRTVNELLGINEEVRVVLEVDMNQRVIKIPGSITNIGVESDENVLHLPFEMTRYYNDIDLSTFNLRINYLNAQGI